MAIWLSRVDKPICIISNCSSCRNMLILKMFYFVFLCGIVCNRVFLCVPVRNHSGVGGKMKMVKISENTDSDQKTSSAGKIFTPPLKTKKAQKPRGYRVFEPFDDKKELHLDCIQY